MNALALPREPHRRSARKVESWWARAFLRVAEEAAYDEQQLAGARALARSGRIGGILVDTGRLAAAVEDEQGLWTVAVTMPVLSTDDLAALTEVLRASPERRLDALDGRLSAETAEHLEEAGVELVPDEITAMCTCGHWHAVCAHALGVLIQSAWAMEADVGVLLSLRGLPEAALEAPAAARARPAEPVRPADPVDDVDVALDAALLAGRLLQE